MVTSLARMSKFVIADLTDAKYIRQELQAIIPNNPPSWINWFLFHKFSPLHLQFSAIPPILALYIT